MKTIVLQDLLDLEQKFLQAVHIMSKEKKFEERWNDHHDAADKVEKQKWAEQRNKFLAELTIKGDGRHHLPQELKVEINKA